MPNSKTIKRRGSGGSPPRGPSQKVPRTSDRNSASGNSTLDQLSKLSTIVADSADFEAIKDFSPTDATTNPTLVLHAVSNPKYKHILQKAVKEAQEATKGKSVDVVVDEAVDRVLVGFGVELLEIIPGLVSTEIPADLSFDQKASVERAKKVVELYKAKGISRDRVLIKVAATWEGIQAAKQLKQEGINCNITLLFSLCQAVAAADAGAFLVSPFVGRILDWHKKQTPDESFSGPDDPGVKSVTQIYNYFKHFGVKTTVMAASFRNTGDQNLPAKFGKVPVKDAMICIRPLIGFHSYYTSLPMEISCLVQKFHFVIWNCLPAEEIVQLAGCDKLTIAPKLLEELRKSTTEVTAKLSVQNAKKQQMQKLSLDEKMFRLMLNDDAMATEKLAEGIRNFSADMNKLKALIKELL